jgi:hypothetical protein
MKTKIWRRRIVWIALLCLSVFLATEVGAQRGGRGGGGGGISRSGAASSGSLGATRSSGASSYSRGGTASGGSFQGSAASQASRQNTAKQMQGRQQAGDAANREDWQNYGKEKQQSRQQAASDRQEDRQNYGKNAREDWQEYGEDYHGGYRGRYYGGSSAYPTGGVAAGMVIGATMTAAAFNAQKASCSSVSVNGVTYQQCGSTWYQPSYSGGSVSYVVVNPPR